MSGSGTSSTKSPEAIISSSSDSIIKNDNLSSTNTPAPISDIDISPEDRLIYIDKAFEAYTHGDFKLSQTLLKHVSLTDEKGIKVYVDCAYLFWRSVQTPDSDSLEQTSDQVEALRVVKDSFTSLLGTVDKKLVGPFDFIRLTHVYLS